MPIIIQLFSSIWVALNIEHSKIVGVLQLVMEMNKKSSKMDCCCWVYNGCNNRGDTIQLKCVTQLLGRPSHGWAMLLSTIIWKTSHTTISMSAATTSQHCVIINIHLNTHATVSKFYSCASTIWHWQHGNKLILNSRNQLPEANIPFEYAVFCSKHDSMHWLMSCSGLYQTWILL